MDRADVSDVHPETPERSAHRRLWRAHGDVPALSRSATCEGGKEIRRKETTGFGEESPEAQNQAAHSRADGEDCQVLGTLPQRGLLVLVAKHRCEKGVLERSTGE